MELTPRTWRDVSQEDLEALVPASILSRGRDYVARGQVDARLVAGDRLAGSVLGSAGWYSVVAVLVDGTIGSSCTCPYQGSPCKHAVALILAWLTTPASFLELHAVSILAEAEPGELRRLCVELCLAAPRAAMPLLTTATSPTGNVEAAAALARNLLAWPLAIAGDPDGFTERLAWIGGILLPAVTGDDAQAVTAAIELAERLLAVWLEAESPPRLTGSIHRYLLDLARAWPREDARANGHLARLCDLVQSETIAFAGEIALLVLAAGGGNTILADARAQGILSLLASGPMPPLVKGVSFEGLLLLLDALERWEREDEALVLAKTGLRRPDEGERYVLRRRLALYHQKQGERRQALAYLTANFRARPDVEGWSGLRRSAQEAGEWPRVKKETWPTVLAGETDLKIRAALDEQDAQLIGTLAETMRAEDPHAAEIWTALAGFEPERGLALLLAGAGSSLEGGGHVARRRAAVFLRALAKVCRCSGQAERWERIRSELRTEYPPVKNWPELGALLAEDAPGPPD